MRQRIIHPPKSTCVGKYIGGLFANCASRVPHREAKRRPSLAVLRIQGLTASLSLVGHRSSIFCRDAFGVADRVFHAHLSCGTRLVAYLRERACCQGYRLIIHPETCGAVTGCGSLCLHSHFRLAIKPFAARWRSCVSWAIPPAVHCVAADKPFSQFGLIGTLLGIKESTPRMPAPSDASLQPRPLLSFRSRREQRKMSGG